MIMSQPAVLSAKRRTVALPTWTQREADFDGSQIKNVRYGSDGYWVAVGDDDKLATSTDGIMWTQRT